MSLCHSGTVDFYKSCAEKFASYLLLVRQSWHLKLFYCSCSESAFLITALGETASFVLRKVKLTNPKLPTLAYLGFICVEWEVGDRLESPFHPRASVGTVPERTQARKSQAF